MYTNQHFDVSELEAKHALIEAAPLGMLVVSRETGPEVAHMPFLLDRSDGPMGRLEAHFPRAEPASFAAADAAKVKIVFCGPAAYVSPYWTGHDGFGTFNFTTVHATCVPTPVEDEQRLRDHLERLTRAHESSVGSSRSWGPDEEPKFERLIPLIRLFEFPILELEAKAKLSQNKSAQERQYIIDRLRRDGVQPQSTQIADLMASYPYVYDEARPLLKSL